MITFPACARLDLTCGHGVCHVSVLEQVLSRCDAPYLVCTAEEPQAEELQKTDFKSITSITCMGKAL